MSREREGGGGREGEGRRGREGGGGKEGEGGREE